MVLAGCHVEMSPSTPQEVLELAIRSEYRFWIIRIIAGSVLAGGGVLLSILGVTGKVDWFVQGDGWTSRLTNASPGVVAIILGALALIRGKPVVRTTGEKEKDPNSDR